MLRIEHAIDMHCHFGPDSVGGSTIGLLAAVTGIEAAREAHACGHKGLVLKSHSFASPQYAAAIAEAVPGLCVFGGICTDHPSGDLNVGAVELSLQLGGRIVWLPTIHSHQDWLNGRGELYGTRGDGIHCLDEDGNPSEEVRAIFELVRKHDAILATGHTTAAEHYAVIKAFARDGKVLVTHAGEEGAGPHLSPEQCRELGELGATIELTALACDPMGPFKGKTTRQMAEMIQIVGHQHCTLATDYGWTVDLPHPAPGLQNFLERLWGEGVPEEQLIRMAATKPAELLGL